MVDYTSGTVVPNGFPVLDKLKAQRDAEKIASFGKLNKIYPARRLDHLILDVGDSRAASFYTGTRQKGANNPINVACALAGQRYRGIGAVATSGQTTAQYLSEDNLAKIVATNAGIARIIGCLNDVSVASYQGTGAAAAANVQRACNNVLLPAGFKIIIEAETGQNAMAEARLAEIYEYNQRMREYAIKTPGVYWHDCRPVVMNQTSSTTTVNFKTNYVYDGTHYTQLGGYYHGKSLKVLLDSIIASSFNALGFNTAELPGHGRFQLLPNPVFNAAANGSTSTGATGTFPGSCTVNKTGALTVACTPAVNNVLLAIDFSADAENARMSQTASNSDWQAGDIVQGVAKFTATSPSGLAGVQLTLNSNVTGSNFSITDMAATAGRAGPDETHTMTLLTDPYVIPAGTENSMSLVIQANSFANGNAFNMNVEFMGIQRRFEGY